MVKAQTETPQTSYLCQDDAAAYLHCSPKTLEGWRITAGGPPFYKVGRRVLYTYADLEAFILKGRRTSTSDTGRNRAAK